jgi:hypothetical protein
MLATITGAAKVAAYLVANGANLTAVDSFGRTAFQLALYYAITDPNYAKTHLEKIYHLVKPLTLTVGVLGKNVITLNDKDGLFFILNFMIAILRYRLTRFIKGNYPSFTTDDFVNALKHFPASTVSPHRRQRGYINSLLSKNEITSPHKNSCKLFMRVTKGEYFLNPFIDIEMENNEYVTVYMLMGLEDFAVSKIPIHAQLAIVIVNLMKESRQFAEPKTPAEEGAETEERDNNDGVKL